jgi:threonine dehydratase
VLLELRDVEGARARIEGRVHLTPMMSSATVGDELGMRLHLKAELFQKTGSFKPRGVFNKLLSLDPGDLSRGLVSLSAGNHAAALAYGASSVGAKATIVSRYRRCNQRSKPRGGTAARSSRRRGACSTPVWPSSRSVISRLSIPSMTSS